MLYRLISNMILFPMSQLAYLIIIFSDWLAILVGVGITIFFHIKAKKKSNKLKYNTIVIGLIFIDMLYSIFNFGWCRYALAIFYIFQSVIFFAGANVSAPYITKCKVVRYMMRLNYVLYILPHIVLPDTLTDDLSVFFGLIELSEPFGSAMLDISLMLSIVNILLLIIQMLVVLHTKKRCT